ncbi:MAG: AMP-binding protein, partial [bacterium]|nr:AMP-binding protein [bacterium]
VGGMLHIAGLMESICATDTVGIMLPTGGGFGPCALAAWWLGKTVVPLNYLLKKEELQYVIVDCGTDTILTAGPMLSFLGYEPGVKNLIKLDEAGLGGVPAPSTPRARREDDLAVILYTSG